MNQAKPEKPSLTGSGSPEGRLPISSPVERKTMDWEHLGLERATRTESPAESIAIEETQVDSILSTEGEGGDEAATVPAHQHEDVEVVFGQLLKEVAGRKAPTNKDLHALAMQLAQIAQQEPRKTEESV